MSWGTRNSFFLILLFFSTQSFAQSDISFLENKCQWADSIRFASQIPGGQMMLSSRGFSYFFLDELQLEQMHEGGHQGDEANPVNVEQQIDAHLVNVSFLGSHKNCTLAPLGKKKPYYNFFVGGDTERWASHVSAFKGVAYTDLYRGIDLTVYEHEGHVKYDFYITPGTDPALIRIAYSGGAPAYASNGDVEINTSLGAIIEKSPVAYQVINGERQLVRCEFKIESQVLSFVFPNGYDPCYELVIDPLLIFSTYSGSNADNWGSTATPGEHGTLYSSGVTNHFVGPNFSGRFPVTPGAFQMAYGGIYDIGILKYDSAGSQLLYASYLGGDNSETPHSLVVNDQHELIVLGTTGSPDFPTTHDALNTTFSGGTAVAPLNILYPNGSDIILSRISADGSTLLASTFLGGSANDGLNLSSALQVNYGDQMRGDVIADASGNIYISTVTSSTDFPVAAGFQSNYQGGNCDAMIAKMDAQLTQVIWGSYVGGLADDAAYSIKFDSQQNILVAGGTNSAQFPTHEFAYQRLKKGGTDGWLIKISADGTAVLASTFTGTSGFDQVYFIDLNENDEVYLYGQTNGDFPVSPNVYSNPNSGQFVQKLDANLSTLVFSTVFGSGRGVPDISPTAFLVNDCNNLYMTGWGGRVNGFTWAANTTDLPISNDAFQSQTSGNDFYFIVLTDDASQFLYGTYMGGNQSLTHVDGGTSRFDKSGVVYHAVCAGCNTNQTGPKSDFPTTPNAWSRTNESNNCNNAAFKFDLSSLKAVLQTNTALLDQPGISKVCLPDPMVFQNFSIGGEKFIWNFGDGDTRNTTLKDTIHHYFPAPGKYVVNLSAYDSGTCKVVDHASVLVTVFQKNMKVQDNDDVCEDYPYNLFASGGVNYNWYTLDGSFTSTLANPPISIHDTTMFHIVIEDSNGCIYRDSVKINLIPKIDIGLDVVRLEACEGRPEVIVRNASDSLWADDRFIVDFGDGQSAEADADLTHEFEADGTYLFKLTGIRKFCTYEQLQPLPVYTLTVPNVITPDENGKNEIFTVQYGSSEGVTPSDFGYATSLTVYNRWGDPVFKQDKYDFSWNGENLPSGVYYFEVTIEDHATCKSWIHIMR